MNKKHLFEYNNTSYLKIWHNQLNDIQSKPIQVDFTKRGLNHNNSNETTRSMKDLYYCNVKGTNLKLHLRTTFGKYTMYITRYVRCSSISSLCLNE